MKALCLLSGGLDSPVATAIMQENNMECMGIHFSIEPFTDDAPERKVKEVCKRLGIQKLFVIKAGSLFAEITRKCDHRLYFVLSKRLMYRIAERIAARESCDVLVTGESLGQVSSQTLKNLSVLSRASQMMVLRPLLAWDKEMIMKKSRELGLFELCSGPEVCDQLGPKHPATGTSENIVEAEELNLDLQKLLKDGVEHAACISIY